MELRLKQQFHQQKRVINTSSLTKEVLRNGHCH